MRFAYAKSPLGRILVFVVALTLLVGVTPASSAIWIANYVHVHRQSFVTNGVMDNYLATLSNGNPVVMYIRNHSQAQLWMHWYRDTDLAELYYAQGGAGDYVITG